MNTQTVIPIVAGLAMLAAGVAAAFTQPSDAWRLGGAVVATLGVILVRRTLRAVRRR